MKKIHAYAIIILLLVGLILGVVLPIFYSRDSFGEPYPQVEYSLVEWNNTSDLIGIGGGRGVVLLSPEGSEVFSYRPQSQSQRIHIAISSISIHPSGDFIAIQNNADTLVFNINTQSMLTNLDTDGKVVAWNETGTQLSVGTSESIEIFDFSLDQSQPTLSSSVATYSHGIKINDISWNPEGTQIVFSDVEDFVHLWEVGNGISRVLFRHPTSNPNLYSDLLVEWSLSDYILTSNSSDQVFVWNFQAERGELTANVKSQLGVWSIDWDYDGDKFTFATEGLIEIWSVDSGQVITNVILSENQRVNAISLNSDGSEFVAVGSIRSPFEPRIWIGDVDSGSITQTYAVD